MQIRSMVDIKVVSFVSTMFTAVPLIQAAQGCGLPIMCGVTTFDDAARALSSSANALKFYPSRAIPPSTLSHILRTLRDRWGEERVDKTPIIVSGGVKEEQMMEYMMSGACGFAIGIDLCQFPSQKLVMEKLSIYEEAWKRARHEQKCPIVIKGPHS
jgi:2-keto-3-deoxy-6-phosphogluconate aldolase